MAPPREAIQPPAAQAPGHRPSRSILVVSRGRALQAVESALTSSGIVLFRANSELGALGLVRAVQPELILIDLEAPAEEFAKSLLSQLKKQTRTRDIPILALVASLDQQAPQSSALRYVSSVMLRNSNVQTILTEVNRLVSGPTERYFHRVDAGTASVDAVFSEIGRRRASRLIKDSERLGSVSPKADQKPAATLTVHGPEPIARETHLATPPISTPPLAIPISNADAAQPASM